MKKRLISSISACLLATFAHGSNFYYVSADSTNSAPPYGDWDNAATDIQTAVDAAANGDTVYIRAGTYTAQPNSVERSGVTAVVDLGAKFVNLIGESGNRGDVIIDGEDVNRGIYAAGTTSGDAQTAILQYLTISNCNATSGSGGGMYLSGSQLQDAFAMEIKDSAFVGNKAWNAGGGIYVSKSGSSSNKLRFRVTNTDFTGNVQTNNLALGAGYRGGAVSVQTGSVAEFDGCRFISNVARVSGGAIFVYPTETYLNLYNCEFRGNTVPEYFNSYSGGAAVNMREGQRLDVRNCLFVNNLFTGGKSLGGAISTYSKATDQISRISSSTFAGNSIYAIYARSFDNGWSDHHIKNSIFYDNSPKDLGISKNALVTNYISHSSFSAINFSQNVVLDNVIAADPLFADPENGDYRLSPGSPCIDTGINEEWMEQGYDLAGKKRIILERVDMGAYEYAPLGTLLMLR